MQYKAVAATRFGSPEVLEVTGRDLRPPAQDEVRIKVLAVQVCRPDVTVRAGESLYHGTPLGQKLPFVPGYAIIGDVDAVGESVSAVRVGDRVGALTVVGGYAEYVYWRADRLIPVPADLDPAAAVTLILNYIVPYQSMHRYAKVQPGESVLITGASGGIGTAALQLGGLAKLKLYGLASATKHAALEGCGATLIDYRAQDFVEVIRTAEPGGLDAVIDAVGGEYIRRSFGLLGHGGTLVTFAEPPSLRALFGMLFRYLLAANLLPNGKAVKFYGTSMYTFRQQPFLEDWANLFALLGEGKIAPVIHQKFPILEAAQANILLESGAVVGNVVLVAPQLL